MLPEKLFLCFDSDIPNNTTAKLRKKRNTNMANEMDILSSSSSNYHHSRNYS